MISIIKNFILLLTISTNIINTGDDSNNTGYDSKFFRMSSVINLTSFNRKKIEWNKNMIFNFDYYFCYEWDCKIGKDYWYDTLWEEHLSWPYEPTMTGTPVFKCPLNGCGNLLQGSVDYRHLYSKECIDTLNLNLSENRDFICIIAGYRKELENCFFKVNPGLERRFPFRYNIEPYSYDELAEILINKLEKENWEISDKNYLLKIIEDNYKYFNHFGGSMEILMLNIKLAQASDINTNYKIITNNILDKSLEMYITNKL